MCNDPTRFNSIKKLLQPIVIELRDNNTIAVSNHGLVNFSQEYVVNALYTPTFRLSLLSINQLDTPGYTTTLDVATAPDHLQQIQSQAIESMISISYLQQLHSC
jgi:hypothetical protein